MTKTAFLFAGQGAQSPGMGKGLCEQSAAARKAFTLASYSLGRDIAKLCFEGTRDELAETRNTQPCVLTVDIAALWALREAGVEASHTAGFSLGEYAALVCAGVLSFEEAIALVQKRAVFMQEACPEGSAMMAVLGVDTEAVESVCAQARATAGEVWAVNYNCPGQTVISGMPKALDAVRELFAGQKAKLIKLPVSGAFHTPFMEPASKKLRHEFAGLSWNTPSIKVFANATAEPYGPGNAPELLCAQVMNPVRWEESIRAMLCDGVEAFVELGPGKTLSGFLKRIAPETPVYRVDDDETLSETLEALTG